MFEYLVVCEVCAGESRGEEESRIGREWGEEKERGIFFYCLL